MNTDQLKSNLSSLLENETISLANDFSFLPNLQNYFRDKLNGTSLSISSPKFNESTLKFSGSGNFLDESTTVGIQFFELEGEIQFLMDLRMPAAWKLDDGFEDYEEKFDNPSLTKCRFVIASTDDVPNDLQPDFGFKKGVSLNAELSINKGINSLKNILGDATKQNLFGDIEVQDGFPILNLAIEIKALQNIGFLDMPIRFLKVVEYLKSRDENGDLIITPMPYFRIESDFEFDNKIIPLSANLFSGDSNIAFEADIEDITLSSLAKLTNSFANSQSLTGALPSGLSLGNKIGFKKLSVVVNQNTMTPLAITMGLTADKVWELNSDFSVDNIDLDIILSNPTDSATRQIYVSVNGNISLGQSTQLNLSANYPDTHLLASLHPGSTIPVSDLFQKFFPIQSFPALDITELSIGLNPSSKDFNLDGKITSDWGINVAGSAITLNEISLNMEKSGDDTSVKISGLTDMLGYRLRLTGFQPGGKSGWLFTGDTELEQPISIKNITTEVLDFFRIDIPLFFPEIDIDYFSVLFGTVSKRFEFSATSFSKFDLFGKKFQASTEVSITSSLDPTTKKRNINGILEAEIEIVDGFKFHLEFGMNDKSPVIMGFWSGEEGHELSLGNFLDALGLEFESGTIQGDVVKPVVDVLFNPLKLQALAFDYNAGDKSITLQAQTAEFGNLIFISSKNETNNRRFQVMGLEFPENFKLSDIPEVGTVLSPADFMNFKQVGLVLSSADVDGFAMPEIPQFAAVDGDDMNSSFLSKANIELSKGLNVVSAIDLDDPSTNDSMKQLKSAGGLSELVVQAAVGKNELNFKSLLAGDVGFDLGKDRMDFKDPFVQIDVLPKFGLQLGGSLLMNFGDTILNTEGAIVISPMEVSGRFMMSAHKGDSGDVNHANATGNLLEPLGIYGVKLNSIGFIVGATFFPPGVKFGMQAGFQIGDQQPSSNQIATILQVIPAVPTPIMNVQLLSFQLNKLSLREALIVFTNDNAPTIPDFMQSVSFSNVGMFYCSTITTMPDGNTAMPGFGFNGSFDILGFKGRAGLKVSSLSGIEGQFQLDPFEVSVGDFTILSVKGKGEKVEEFYVKEDGTWKKVNNEEKLLELPTSETNLPVPETRTELILSEGGPVLEFSSNGPRYLYGSVDIVLFEFIHYSTEVELNSEGFKFLFNYQVSDILNMGFDFAVNWAGGDYGFYGKTWFNLDLDFHIDLPSILGFDLGSIHIDAGLDASAMIKVDTKGFSFKINGAFEFEGTRFEMPELSLSVNFGSLANLPKMIFDHIISKAGEIFMQLIAELEAAWEDVKQFFVDGYEATKQLVEDIAKEAVEFAEDVAEFAEKTVAQIEEGIKEVGEDIKKAVKEAGEFVEKVGKEIVEIGKKAQEFFEDVGEAAVVVFEAAKEAFNTAIREAAKFVENVAKEIVQFAKDVAKVIENIGKEIAKAVGQIVKAAEEFFEDVVELAKKAVEYIEKAVRELEKLAAAIWNEIEEFFENVGEAIEDAAEEVGEFFEDAGKSIVGALSSY